MKMNRKHIIATAARLIMSNIYGLNASMDKYPEIVSMSSCEQALKYVPDSLQTQFLFAGKNVDSKIASMGKAIMQATDLGCCWRHYKLD